MAISAHVTMEQAEFRRYRESVGKDGKPRLYCTFEDFDGNSNQVSVTDVNLISSCKQKLVKAHIYALDLMVRAGDEYSYMVLLSEPMEYDA